MEGLKDKNSIEIKDVIKETCKDSDEKNDELKNIEQFIELQSKDSEAINKDIATKLGKPIHEEKNIIKETIEQQLLGTFQANENDINQPSTSSGRTHVSNLKPKFVKRTHTQQSSPIRKKLKPNVEPEVENLLEGMKDDIDEVLEKTAQKNKLTARNVRNILRHVITNEHVLAMVWNTMNSNNETDVDREVPEAFYQPKLTRSKFRQLKGQAKDSKETNMESGVNQKTGSGKLLVTDFPENESSDDDFEPPEAEEETDEDDLNTSVAASDFGSPDFTNSKTPEIESASAHSEDETRLVIEEPEKTEEIEEKPISSPSTLQIEEGTIFLRTRSKLPLDDTPLESIEAAFIAPDITVDMYDSDCDDDDWKAFLNDFYKPITTAEQTEDDVNDPEYNFIEDDNKKTDQWDLRNDRAVKVSKKELNELIAELLEAAEQDQQEVEDDDEDDDLSMKSSPPRQVNLDTSTPNDPECLFLTPQMTLILEEQMRMHVQLLAQTFLLTHSYPELKVHGDSAKTLLNELNQFSKKEFPDPNRKSAFAAHNLPEALELIEKIEKDPDFVKKSVRTETAITRNIGRDRTRPKPLPKRLQDILVTSTVFIYPQLLPTIMMEPKNSGAKTLFFPSEDQLIAYGLEQFSPIKGVGVNELIKTHMVPVKSERSIKLRIKNLKHSKLVNKNPIANYFAYGKAPHPPLVIPTFNPKDVKPLAVRSCKIGMPDWIIPYMKYMYPKLSPKSLQYTPTKISPKMPKTTPKSRTPASILPRIQKSPMKLHHSPMKHVSSILRKYGVRNSKLVVRGSLNFLSPTKKPVSEPKYVHIAPKINPLLVISPPEIIVKPILPEEVPIKVSDDKLADALSPDPVGSCPDDAGNDQGSQSEIDTCEEGEDNEDEPVDKEVDLAALMEASSTICKKNTINVKKKKKHERELESLLPLLANDLVESDPQRDAREIAFANVYFQKVKETLVDDAETFESFLTVMHDCQSNGKTAVELYQDIKMMFKNYPSLIDEFVPFLLPEQAKECDRLKDHVLFVKSQTFLRKLEVQFGNQPSQLQKIIKMLGHLQKQNDLNPEQIHASLNPLLRSRNHMLEELSLLIPDERPPERLMTDFEEFKLPDSDAELVDEDGNDYEEIFVPDTEDPYGTKDCPCSCHSNSSDLRMQHRKRHCVQCGLRFIDGRIFLLTGKVLKPAQVICHSKLNLKDSEIKEELVPQLNSDEVVNETTENCAIQPWTKDEDAYLLKTCQKLHGTGDENEYVIAFEDVFHHLKTRSLESIKNRFKELLSLFIAHKSDEELETDEENC